MLSIQKSYLLEETTKLSALEIGTEGKIETPEGMLLTMTVDGVQKDVLPGSYRGDIVLTVTRRIPAPIEGMHPKPGDPPTDYRAVLCWEKTVWRRMLLAMGGSAEAVRGQT